MSVKLRSKALKDGKASLYLDCYQRGKRNFQFLNLYLTGNKAVDKATLKLAHQVRSQRELEVATGRFGFSNLIMTLGQLVDEVVAQKVGSTRTLYCRASVFLFEIIG